MLQHFSITFLDKHANASNLFTFINAQWTDEINRVTTEAMKGLLLSNVVSMMMHAFGTTNIS